MMPAGSGSRITMAGEGGRVQRTSPARRFILPLSHLPCPGRGLVDEMELPPWPRQGRTRTGGGRESISPSTREAITATGPSGHSGPAFWTRAGLSGGGGRAGLTRGAAVSSGLANPAGRGERLKRALLAQTLGRGRTGGAAARGCGDFTWPRGQGAARGGGGRHRKKKKGRRTSPDSDGEWTRWGLLHTRSTGRAVGPPGRRSHPGGQAGRTPAFLAGLGFGEGNLDLWLLLNRGPLQGSGTRRRVRGVSVSWQPEQEGGVQAAGRGDRFPDGRRARWPYRLAGRGWTNGAASGRLDEWVKLAISSGAGARRSCWTYVQGSAGSGPGETGPAA